MRYPHAAALVASAALLCGFSTLSAQQPQPPLEPRDRVIEVTVAYSLTLPIRSEEPAVQREALEIGRRVLYEMAAGECQVLEATIASSCRLERLNLQNSVQRQAQVPNAPSNIAQLGANASYRVGLKSRP